MSASSTRKLYGRISDNEHPTLEGNVKRMDLVPEGTDDDWYIEYREGFEDGTPNTVVPGGPPQWVKFPEDADITVVRRVKAGEFMAFLDVTRRFAKPTELRAVASSGNGNPPRSKVSSKGGNIAVDFGMSGGSGSSFSDYEEWPSCPSTLGFRC